MNSLDHFHPAVAGWFLKKFPAPTEAQERAWESILARSHTLVAAPTGSGKTLAAFLGALDDLVRKGTEGTLEDATYVVYVSPLKALSNDIQINLQEPLAGIQDELLEMGLTPPEIRILVRTGDTPASSRASMARRPPHIIVTTPESLFILLTSESGRRMLKTTHTLILDEIHAIVQDKRGSHLALSIERLEALVDGPLVRIGLSATQRPIEEVARYLVGPRNINSENSPQCRIVDTGHARPLDLGLELPGSPLEAVLSNEVWEEIYDRLAVLVREHKTTIIFVNTRRLAERVARHLSDRLGEETITSHHGSLSREQRLGAERRLKSGELSALVATASLELGIDIGTIDLVCQLGSTRSIATMLQRVGRSGHSVGGRPKGRIFPMTRDELIDCAAILDAVKRKELDRLEIPEKPLDILAQQIVAEAAGSELSEDSLYQLCLGAYPYRNLERREFDEIVRMLAEGFTTRRGRRGAYIFRDAINHRITGRRGARLAAVTSGGAIPDSSDYQVILEPGDIKIGTINEDFAVESLAGDIFQLGNISYRVRRVETGSVRVEDAHGQPPSIPFWLGEAPARTAELSNAVSRLRQELADRLNDEGMEAAIAWLQQQTGVQLEAAQQIVEYVKSVLESLGAVPTSDTIIVERFFDEAGGTEIVIHSPFGSRINRAWGLALRKRFCRKFNFELQAAATENSILFSFGPTHSFPLESIFEFLRSESAEAVLTQALLDSPMFTVRWRWTASRALAVLRWRSGRKIPPQLQRMMAEDLLALIFPDQLACAENLVGEICVPDHPLVRQTVRDCLHEAMDIDGLIDLLKAIERGEKKLIARELTQASPLAQEVLSARPYSYLDDAPLEERRAQAVQNRRWQNQETNDVIGSLDLAAIERVREEAWPEARSYDELHDALIQLGFLTEEEGRRFDGASELLEELKHQRRAAEMHFDGFHSWIAAERLPQLRAVYPDALIDPSISPPEEILHEVWTSEDALVELLRGRLEHLGPQMVATLADSFKLPPDLIQQACYRLEGEGFLMQGRFTLGAPDLEWCARHLLARIHNYTLSRLRSEIEPVTTVDFMRFLSRWQRVDSEEHGEGPDSLLAVIEQLEGFEAAAASWESDILPARLSEYDPAWLDLLCQAGKVLWVRMTPSKQSVTRPGVSTVRQTPITLIKRENLPLWGTLLERSNDEPPLGSNTRLVFDYLKGHGASFFADLVRGTALLPAMVEESLGELVAAGVTTSDSFIGVRTLLMRPTSKEETKRRKRSSQFFGMENAGRWSLVATVSGNGLTTETTSDEMIARKLLGRYGVVFRRLLERENTGTTWAKLLRIYRRLEARGDIRGGRFVAGFSGEQFALAEAVSILRSVRRSEPTQKLTSVSATDPLNLVGITSPGQRVASHAGNRILFRDGIAIAVLEAKEIRYLVEMEPDEAWQARGALLRRQIPPQLRPYLKSSEAAFSGISRIPA